MALKWGIASAGKISHDFVTAIGTLSPAEHKVVAVAARDLNRAKEFADLHEIRHAYGSYLELANDSGIEVVYVGTLNPQHYDVATLMLQHGKHVLCEKPLCMNAKQSQKLIDLAKEKNLFLMEAIWSRFFPSYVYIRNRIKSGDLGEITKVKVDFGFELAEVDRLSKKTLGGGTVLDLGVYTIQVAQWAFDEAPTSITASGTLNDEGCDLAMNAVLSYGGDRVANIATSALKQLDNVAVITGTKGQIIVKEFWSSTAIIDVDGTEKTWTLPEAKHKFNFKNSCGLRYEAEEARKCIRSNRLESDSVTHSDSLTIAKIEDEIRLQIGVHYDADD